CQFSSNWTCLDLLLAPGCYLAVFLAAHSRRFRLGSFYFTPEGCPRRNVRHLKDISNFLPVETAPAQVEHRATLIVEIAGQSLQIQPEFHKGRPVGSNSPF